MNGTNVPETIKSLSKHKIVTVFVDGDRGGDLIIKELMLNCELDYITKAPDGKEVEEITKKELHKAIRSKVTLEQYKLDKGMPSMRKKEEEEKPVEEEPKPKKTTKKKLEFSDEDKSSIREMADELIGSRGAYLLDEKLEVMGKVPISELETTLAELESKVFLIVMDGEINEDNVVLAKKANVKCMVGKEIATEDAKGIELFETDSF